MSNYQQREYYKIFAGTNQTEGHDKIHLGYEAKTSEIVFAKDKITFFHMPFFSDVVFINSSTLIESGATSGPIPALSDRIYKKLGNYSKTTPWGQNTSRNDGTWLCSWLYQEKNETPVWLDRYYNPGRIAYKEALEGKASFNDYIKNDTLYYDISSTLTLEPGGYFSYFHLGNKSLEKIVDTYAGDTLTNKRLEINNWSSDVIDSSTYNNSLIIKEPKPYWFIQKQSPGFVERNILSFDNSDFIDVKVLYNDSYNLKNEFTLSLWVNHKDWKNATTSQLVGNLYNGGFSLCYNNLNCNPYFVVPETTYGHLYYFNQENEIYTERNIKPTSLSENITPISININSNLETIVLDSNNRLIKYNHLGDILTSPKNTNGENVAIIGTPKQSIIDKDDNTIVVTTSGTYIFDKDLIFKESTPDFYKDLELLSFDINGNLIRELSCVDIKHDLNNNKWHIKTDHRLYYNNELYTELENETILTIGIDPNNNLWAVTSSDKIFIINILTSKISNIFSVGISRNDVNNKKNISFINTYDRSANTFNWYAVLYSSNEQTLYQVTLNGNTIKSIFLPEKLNILDPDTATQDKQLLTFTCKGDFTGYEKRRIFNKINFNNEPQIQFKVSLNPPFNTLPVSIYTLTTSAKNFVNNSWQLITITYSKKQFKLYVNNTLRDTLDVPINYTQQFNFKNDLHIGTPTGKTGNFNYETNTDSFIWNGEIDTLRIYDYSLNEKFLQPLINEKTLTFDIVWNIPTTSLQYIEVIERFFKHRMPGIKSQFFNIKINGSKITDSITRKTIENTLREVIEKIKPAYTDLLRVEWVD